LLYGLHRLDFLPAVAENQPANKNRMTTELSNFAARLRESIQGRNAALRRPVGAARRPYQNLEFDTLALELFALQFQHNAAYRKICAARGFTPGVVEHWTQIPAVPTSAFKELELTCLAPAERTVVFHSSGTTEQKPSRHYHGAESLKVYEASLWPWFARHVVPEFGVRSSEFRMLILAPPPAQVPHSSLVHMFETIRQKIGAPKTVFVGKIATDGSWTLDFDAVLVANSSLVTRHSSLLLGTAFSFVHFLDFLAERNLRFDLPAGSRVMETGGYKNRSCSLPKMELHQLITERLGVPPSHIVCEYGMSELSSQAYAHVTGDGWQATGKGSAPRHSSLDTRHFIFPPWARVQIISPETGLEVADGETGLIRVFDLANVFSVMAIQTEDLAVRHGGGFELLGRATQAEPRGCSLMAQSAFYNPQSAIK
jgi:hypothetical protein